MSKYDIKIDQNFPSDEDLLKRKNFDEALGKANALEATKVAQNAIWKSYWFWIGLGVFAVGIGLFVFPSFNGDEPQVANTDSQVNKESDIQSKELAEIQLSNTDNLDAIAIPKQVVAHSSEPKSETSSSSPEKYEEHESEKVLFEPMLATDEVFQLAASFNITEGFEEFEGYENLKFQPVGSYEKGWLNVQWEQAELKKEDDKYFITFTKKSYVALCEVLPVFEAEDLLKAQDLLND